MTHLMQMKAVGLQPKHIEMCLQIDPFVRIVSVYPFSFLQIPASHSVYFSDASSCY